MAAIDHGEVGARARGDCVDEHAGTGEAPFSGRRSAVRRWRRRVAYAIVAIGGVVVVAAGAIGAWRYDTESRIGWVELLNDEAPVIAQVFDESGERTIGEPFDLATRAVLALPDEDYRLRVNGVGRMGRTYRFAVNRGETLSHTVSINEGRLLGGEQMIAADVGRSARPGSFPSSRVLGAREILPGKADFIEFGTRWLIRRDGAGGKVIWDAFHPQHAFANDRDPVRWMCNRFQPERMGGLMDQVPDLDGDGAGDLVLFGSYTPGVVALSGKDGSMIWNYAGELNGPGGPTDQCPTPSDPPREGGFAAGGTAMLDVDRDGTRDVCVTFVYEEPMPAVKKYKQSSQGFDGWERVRRRSKLVALSGRTGRCLWTHLMEADFVETTREREIRPAELVRGRRTAVLSVMADNKWVGLDPATGHVQAGPVEVFTSTRLVGHADLDGDGEPEMVMTEAGPGSRQATLRVWSTHTGEAREAWSQTIDARFDSSELRWPGDPPTAPPSCPLVVDLDGDGRSEIVVTDAGLMPPLSGYRGVRLLDGRNGATRWRCAAGGIKGGGWRGGDRCCAGSRRRWDAGGRDCFAPGKPRFAGADAAEATAVAGSHLGRCVLGEGWPRALVVEAGSSDGARRPHLDTLLVGVRA